jgi:hypothetical protein
MGLALQNQWHAPVYKTLQKSGCQEMAPSTKPDYKDAKTGPQAAGSRDGVLPGRAYRAPENLFSLMEKRA